MTPDCWEQINRLYHAAQEVTERSSFLEQACEGDAELRREVESLLAAHQQASKFIEAPALRA